MGLKKRSERRRSETVETLCQWEEVERDADVLQWVMANRNCKITEVPHWIIMALMEDVAHCSSVLTEQVVKLLDDSIAWAADPHYLKHCVEKLTNNVLLASLYEDGNIQNAQGLLHVLCLFDFKHKLYIDIDPVLFGEGDGQPAAPEPI
jgi:hypothetical protein